MHHSAVPTLPFHAAGSGSSLALGDLSGLFKTPSTPNFGFDTGGSDALFGRNTSDALFGRSTSGTDALFGRAGASGVAGGSDALFGRSVSSSANADAASLSSLINALNMTSSASDNAGFGSPAVSLGLGPIGGPVHVASSGIGGVGFGLIGQHGAGGGGVSSGSAFGFGVGVGGSSAAAQAQNQLSPLELLNALNALNQAAPTVSSSFKL